VEHRPPGQVDAGGREGDRDRLAPAAAQPRLVLVHHRVLAQVGEQLRAGVERMLEQLIQPQPPQLARGPAGQLGEPLVPLDDPAGAGVHDEDRLSGALLEGAVRGAAARAAAPEPVGLEAARREACGGVERAHLGAGDPPRGDDPQQHGLRGLREQVEHGAGLVAPERREEGGEVGLAGCDDARGPVGHEQRLRRAHAGLPGQEGHGGVARRGRPALQDGRERVRLAGPGAAGHDLHQGGPREAGHVAGDLPVDALHGCGPPGARHPSGRPMGGSIVPRDRAR
jgi:hypothetical protein